MAKISRQLEHEPRGYRIIPVEQSIPRIGFSRVATGNQFSIQAPVNMTGFGANGGGLFNHSMFWCGPSLLTSDRLNQLADQN